jgi:hypothetical protein
MKYLLIVALLTGCASKPDYTEVEWALATKKARINQLYLFDSSKASQDMLANMNSVSLKNGFTSGFTEERIAQLHEHEMKLFYKGWNKPYKLEKDTGLSLQTYLDYCKNFGHDPKTYVKFMD